MDLDPWARKKQQRAETARERSIPTSKIAGYLIAFIAVGVVAVASFEMLVLA